MGVILGIDLGSTACRVAVHREGSTAVIPTRFADQKFKPFVSAQGRREGTDKRIQFLSLKQKIGFEEKVQIRGEVIPLLTLTEELFSHALEDARKSVQDEIDGAVIAVPPIFADKQRAAIKKAAQGAGLAYVELLEESSAAVLALGGDFQESTFLVFNLGACIFSVSVIRKVKGKPNALWHEGDKHLGGYLFDASIMDFIFARLDIDASFAGAKLQKLKTLAEEKKIALSGEEEVDFHMHLEDYFESSSGSGRGVHMFSLTRKRFESMISSDIERAFSLCQAALDGARIKPDAVNAVILNGGSTLIPLVNTKIRELFHGDLIQGTDTTIASGSAIYAAQLPKIKIASESVNGTAKSSKKPERAESSSADDPASATGWLGIFESGIRDSESLWQKGKQEEAIASLENVRREMGKYIAHLYYSRGISLTGSDPDEGLRFLSKACSLEPGNNMMAAGYHDACEKKTFALIREDDLSGALDSVRLGLKLKPDCTRCADLKMRIQKDLSARKQARFAGSKKHKKRRG